MFEINQSLLTFIITEYKLIYKWLQVFIVCLWCSAHSPGRSNFQKVQWRWEAADEASVDFWMLSSHHGVEGRRQGCVRAKRFLVWAKGMEWDGILSKCKTIILPGGRLHGMRAYILYEEVKSAAGDIFLGLIWEMYTLSRCENKLWRMDLPIEVVDILYVSKKGWSFFCPQRKFGLVPDAVKVILGNQGRRSSIAVLLQVIFSLQDILFTSVLGNDYTNVLINSTMKIQRLSFIDDST